MSNKEDKSYQLSLLIVLIAVVGFFCFQYGKGKGGDSKDKAYENTIDSLRYIIVVKQNIITENKEKRLILSDSLEIIKHQRDSLFLVKGKVITIHDGKVDIINNANNDDIVELFSGYHTD